MANHEGPVTSVPLRLHTVLLALAGRVDDSALGHARHLCALARIDEAAELIAGTLIAGGIPLRPQEQRELGDVFAASGADVALLDHLIVTEHDVEPSHEFGANDQPDEGITQAFEPIADALPDVRSIHAVWRNTASGRVPGQVPQRVVLVELGAEGSPPATAHLVAAALRNAGIRAVVEVASADVAWPRYHQQALAAAVAVVGARETSRQEQAAPVAEREPAPERPAAAEPERPAAPEPERPAASERRGESAGFFTAQEKPAFAAHAGPERSNGHGEPAPAHAVATAAVAATSTAANGTNETNGYAPPRTNGHHRTPERPSESFWPQPQQQEHVVEQPPEPPRAEHAAAPAPTDHAPRNDHAVEPPRSHHAAEPPRIDHGVEPRPENGYAPPRAEYSGEPPRNGHSAEPPRADWPAVPRQHDAVESAHAVGPQNNGHAPEPPHNHTAEPFHNAQPAEPRNGYPEAPRNGHHAEPLHNGHPADPSRADRPAEPPRNDYSAEPPNHGGSNVVNFPESEAESTAEMARNDAQQLHQALREAEVADRSAPQQPQSAQSSQAPQREAVELPAADAEAQLSDRDRDLLRELHAELAKREREQAAHVQLNGWHRPGG